MITTIMLPQLSQIVVSYFYNNKTKIEEFKFSSDYSILKSDAEHSMLDEKNGEIKRLEEHFMMKIKVPLKSLSS